MKKDTILTTAGRSRKKDGGAINPPVYRASTVAFSSIKAFTQAQKNRHETFYYGRYGTPTTKALESAISELEGSGRTIVTTSGLGAITLAFLAYLDTGDHVLVADNVYAPVRSCCQRLLKRLGIAVTYYDPMDQDAVARYKTPKTRMLYLEGPGSLTFETPDLPRLAASAREHDLLTVFDNTWATPYFLKPRDLGADVSVIAGTKYLSGHADVMLGAITAPTEDFDRLRTTANFIGSTPGPDDCYLVLRGLRTLGVRLRRHQENGFRLATWLADRPEVDVVLHPAFPATPGHEIWRRDYAGASGLFGLVLKPVRHDSVTAMVDGLELFSIGASWGGFESLMTLETPERHRSAVPWTANGPTLRVHAGLEDPDDLIEDLAAGFARLNRAEGSP